MPLFRKNVFASPLVKLSTIKLFYSFAWEIVRIHATNTLGQILITQ